MTSPPVPDAATAPTPATGTGVPGPGVPGAGGADGPPGAAAAAAAAAGVAGTDPPGRGATAGVADSSAQAAELRAEQRYVAALYARLDLLRAETRERLRGTRLSRVGGNPQAQSERDAMAARDEARLAHLLSAEEGLCFGRVDRDQPDGEVLHIGRLGLAGAAQERLLVDWRAPAAEAFYRATAVAPLGLRRRRHLRTTGRQVLDVDDEVFDLDTLTDHDRASLSGEGALFAALAAERTGRMRDVVATLQAEQDRVVRAPLDGVLVVQGGPGTGKTVVALHRAAYLLYTYRERLARSGVLVVGPGGPFLRYVEQVLPSLGETAVVLATLPDLIPGVRVEGADTDDATAVKGDRRMVGLLAAAVRDRQRLLDTDTSVRVDDAWLRVSRRLVERARDRARATRRPHNDARNTFVRMVLENLAGQQLGRAVWDGADRTERAETLRDLIRAPQVRAVLDRCWPHLTPTRLLTELWADPAALRRAATAAADLGGADAGVTGAELGALQRPPGVALSPADVPLLDEAAVLLGTADPWARRRAEAAQAERTRAERYARDVLSSTGAAAAGFVDAATLAARFDGADVPGDLAGRALADAEWVFGHAVVDEAQELSWMAWRMLARRVPSRSMTVVGDLAQAASPAAPVDWAAALADHAPGAWSVAELTIGYRTPAAVMAIAARVLARINPALTAPRAVRDTGRDPVLRTVAGGTDPAVLARAVTDVVAAERAGGSGGRRVAVLAPAARVAALTAALTAALGVAEVGPPSTHPVAVLSVAAAKGLEFDAVVLVDAQQIAAGPRGLRDLYVALTRTTDALTCLHPAEPGGAVADLLAGPAGPA